MSTDKSGADQSTYAEVKTDRSGSENSVRPNKIDVYDFFSGCGGTSAGLRKSGMNPVIAVDFDKSALETYAHNFSNSFPILSDIKLLSTSSIEHHFEKNRINPILMCACAPCQPFSTQNRNRTAADSRASLLGHLRRFVARFRPELLLIENVPGMDRKSQTELNPMTELIAMLDDFGYQYDSKVVFAHDYGVPQSRKRLIVVASLFGEISFPEATHGTPERPHLTVHDAIGHLPAIGAGENDLVVPNHRSSALTDLNLQRIRASQQGGSWNDWPENLRLECHKDFDGYPDVYGRLSWHKPAPALTTKCTSYSNGRFGHPEQDRAISIREAACLQTFDLDFEFLGGMNAMAKQIGNAVPVRLAEVIGNMFMAHVDTHLRGING